jgi:hypothetical protein
MRELSFTAAEAFRSPESLVHRMRTRRQETKTMTRKQLRLRLQILDALAKSATQDETVALRASDLAPSA